MKIGYVAGYDATDVRHWSGSGFNIWRSLEMQGHEILHFQPPPLPQHLNGLLGSADQIIRKLSHRRYLSNHSVVVARYQAKKTDQWVAAHPDIDAILSPGTIPVAFMAQHKPLITWSDATHRALFSADPRFRNISRVSHLEGDIIEKRSLRRASAAIFSSSWAAESAIRDYGAHPNKIRVIPFGANLDDVPVAFEVEELIQHRSLAAPEILFAGVNWEGKGGDRVVALIKFLRDHGIAASMRILGCDPPAEVATLPWVKCEGFISKQTSEGRQRISQIFRSASLLTVLSVAECYGLVYCEANAHGVPVVGCNVGGVSTIIRDGENGFLLEPGHFRVSEGLRLLNLFRNRLEYQRMSRAAREIYEKQLNWNVAGRAASEIMVACVSSSRGRAER